MAERTHITNFLLLSVLAGILLVTGSLQCAFDCLTQVDDIRVTSNRVDTCHQSINQPTETDSCLNKACHQSSPDHRDLGSPEIYRLEKLAQPLYSNSRQPAPQFRAGTAVALAPIDLQPELRLQATTSDHPQQIQFSIRSTVILC